MTDMPGGFRSEMSPPNDEVCEILNGVKENVEQEAGSSFSEFELVHYTTQVVAGTIYLMLVKVDGDEHLHVKIVKPLPHTGQPPKVMTVKRGVTPETPMLPS
eukprot:CAMPEP_0185024372 /NCGR_PEP_ID=MMETSP1103-20130426/7413_1 /TAXON_ID=36769 /ORGANISM="Paraphysomonas bandaiensis, Strain Caron Lab Isolate" /LENGTH=101 /DNA_ID=CAMNT_0027557319 /DNA_START=72 /DNA_END=377 /DNA_ORIENTATION=+